MKKILIIGVLVLLGLSTLSAQAKTTRWIAGDLAWYPANLEGYGVENFAPIDYDEVTKAELNVLGGISDEGRDLGGQGFEARAVFGYETQLPFMEGTSPLTKDNNVKFRFTGEISPVTIAASAETVATPIAFLSFFASATVGSGWAIGDISGLSFNTPDKTFEPAPLEGAVITAHMGGTFQFDFGVLVPGDWTHVVVVYRPSLQYEMFTAASGDEAWLWQADAGENYNGWNWKQLGVLGYQLPAVEHVDTTGVLIETEQRVTKQDVSTMDSGGWGSDFMTVYVSPFVALKLNANNALTVQAQLARGRDYTDKTIGNAHFSNRKVDTGSPTYWYFRRVALSYRYEY
jgi:hypothetical protein